MIIASKSPPAVMDGVDRMDSVDLMDMISILSIIYRSSVLICLQYRLQAEFLWPKASARKRYSELRRLPDRSRRPRCLDLDALPRVL